jgi:hypothetical protein
MEPTLCPGEASGVGDGDESAKLAEVHWIIDAYYALII